MSHHFSAVLAAFRTNKSILCFDRRDDWSSFDDGLGAGCSLLEITDRRSQFVHPMVAFLRQYVRHYVSHNFLLALSEGPGQENFSIEFPKEVKEVKK